MRQSKRDRKIAAISYDMLENFYFFRLCNVALAQFEYDGLPDTCDRRYLELCALRRGTAAIYQPRGTDFLLSTGWMHTSAAKSREAVVWYTSAEEIRPTALDKYFNCANTFDVYGNPTAIIGVGANGETSDTDNFAVFYDNMTREPLIVHVRRYAQMLAQIHKTFLLNLQQQRAPYIVASAPSKMFSMRKLWEAIEDFIPWIEVDRAISLEDDIKTFDLHVDYKGTEFLENMKEIWNQALNMLGISAMSTKKERLITGELDMNRQGDLVTMNSRLLNRIEFCEKCNAKFGTAMSVRLSTAAVDYTSVFGDILGMGGDMNGELYGNAGGDSAAGEP